MSVTSEPTGEPESTAEAEHGSLDPTGEPESTVEPTSRPEAEHGSLDPYGKPVDMPSHAAILVPPLLIMFLSICGLFILSCVTQKLWWKKKLDRKAPKPRRRKSDHTCFLTQIDEEILSQISLFQNLPFALLKIAAPYMITLAFSPVSMYLYRPLLTLFWPPKDFTSQPNVNDAIQAFLTPAGLVYAIAFGFAFQEATKVQSLVNDRLSNMTSCVFNIAFGCLSLGHIFTKEDRGLILSIVKEEAMIWIRQVLAYSSNIVDHNSRLNEIVTVVKNAQNRLTRPMDKTFIKKILHDVYKLEQLTLHSLDKMCGSMDALQWSFLETLALLAFFGVLMLNSESYLFQWTICIITVFSISIFCYILADLDNPYHGFYRMDLEFLPAMVQRLETVATENGYIPPRLNPVSQYKDHGRFSMDNIVIPV